MTANFTNLRLVTGMGGNVAGEVENPAPIDIVFDGTSIDESSLVGATVGTAIAIDPTGAPFAWSIYYDPDDKFAIDAVTGVYTLAATVDYETQTTHPLGIQVINRFGEVLRKQTDIDVNDFDEGQPPAAPVNIVAPSISGTVEVDHVLTANPGIWIGNSVPGFRFQWKRNGVAITNALSSKYTLKPTDQSTSITVTVTGTNAQGSSSATSAAVGPVAASGFLVSRYISTSAAGNQSGTSWANAGALSKLGTFIREAGPDGIVYIRADAGIYSAARFTVAAGGTVGHVCTVRGVDVNLVPTPATINGSRANPWTYGASQGGDVIFLTAGSNYLSFEFLNFTNCGNGCFRFADATTGVTIESCTAFNVRRFVECNISGVATDATATDFAVRNIVVRGFSKGVTRFRYSSTGGVIEDVLGDSQEQDGDSEDGDNFAVGIEFNHSANNIAVSRVKILRCVQTQKNGVPLTENDYWNGDGFTSENACHDITYTDCEAYGCTDGGFDNKGSALAFVRCRSGDNKRNFRTWGTASYTDCFSFDPYLRGGTGGASGHWVGSGGHVTVTNSAYCLPSNVAFSTTEMGASADLTTINTSIQGTVSNGNSNGAAIVFDTTTPPPNVVVPAVTGSAVAGQTLSCSDGTWSGSGFSFTRQWKANGRFISEATATTFVLTSAEIDKIITCTVYAKNSDGYVGEATSNATEVVVGTAPTIASAFLSGKARDGGILTINPVGITGFPAPSLTYHWYRDGVVFGNPTQLTTETTYVLVTSDVGHVISCQVKVSNPAGDAYALAPGLTIGAKILEEAYIGPARAGTGDGTSWANQGKLSDLNSFVAGLLAGSTVYIAADQGQYLISGGGPTLSHGGSGDPDDTTPPLSNFITIQGVNADLSPAMATLVGSRTDFTANYEMYLADNEFRTSVNSWSAGPPCFALKNGANYLIFDHFRFERMGNGCFYINPTDPGDGSDWCHHLHFTNIEVFNAQRCLEFSGNDLIKVGYVRLEDWNCIGWSKGVVRFKGDCHDFLLLRVYGDSARQDRDNFAMGLQSDNTAHNMECIQCTMKNCTDTINSYWNADGFEAAGGNYNIYFEDCISTGHTDAGIDTKQDLPTPAWLDGATHTYRLRAQHAVDVLRGTYQDNKKNIKMWGHLKLKDVTVGLAHIRGGSSGPMLFSLSRTEDPVGHTGFTFVGGTVTGPGHMLEELTGAALGEFYGTEINDVTDLRIGSSDTNGWLRLFDCTGNSVPTSIVDYSVPTHRGSDASDLIDPGPDMPLGMKDDLVVVVMGIDTDPVTPDPSPLEVVGVFGDVWNHETQIDQTGWKTRLAWRRLTAIEYGPIGSTGFISGFAHYMTASVFGGVAATGAPYEGYATSTAFTGAVGNTIGTAPAVTVSGNDRMVANFHISSDNEAVGAAPAGYTQIFSGSTSFGSDAGAVFDAKGSVSAGVSPATTRHVRGQPTTCFSMALKPKGASIVQPGGIPGTWTNLDFEDTFTGSALDDTKWRANWLGSTDGAITPGIQGTDGEVAYDPAQVTVGGGVCTLSVISSPVTVSGHLYPRRSGIIQTAPHYSINPTAGHPVAIEARIWMEALTGTTIANFPAFWLNGFHAVAWPDRGEIDIEEGLNGDAASHVHYGTAGNDSGNTRATDPPGDCTGWHKWGLLWTSDPDLNLKFYKDEALFATLTPRLTNYRSLFDNPMYLVIDLASRNDDGVEKVPGSLKIDYVRVWTS